MNHYEMMVLYTPVLTDDEQKAQVTAVEEILNKEKASLHFIDHWGKKKLAYTIKKQRQGFYEWFYFEMDPSRVTEVERKLKMSEQVLRFMVLKMEKQQIALFNAELERRKQAAAAPPPAPLPAVEASEPAAAEAVPPAEEPVIAARTEEEPEAETLIEDAPVETETSPETTTEEGKVE